VKLTEFTFKTGNRKGCNKVIRKRVPNTDDPMGKEVTISSGGNMITNAICDFQRGAGWWSSNNDNRQSTGVARWLNKNKVIEPCRLGTQE